MSNDLTLSGVLNVSAASGFGTGTYTLFSYGGALTMGTLTLGSKPSGYGFSISTNTPNEVDLLVTMPQFQSVNVSGTQLLLSGVGGPASGDYFILATTNLALPASQWTQIASGQFDSTGHFNFTNSLDPGRLQFFFRLSLP